MDREEFDILARRFSQARSRRAALATVVGGAFAGLLGAASAKPRRRRRGERNRISAQAADCSSLGHDANVSGCDFSGEDHSAEDLYSSRMVGTSFREGTLVQTDLSSSNLKNANFRDANLCRADLRSSGLGGGDFRDANLAHANLKSSGGCGSANFGGATFCGTVMCNGSVRNDACPGGPGSAACCTDSDCPQGQVCEQGVCVEDAPCTSIADCPFGQSCLQGVCIPYTPCDEGCSAGCDNCFYLIDGSVGCGDIGLCRNENGVSQGCNANSECEGGFCVVAIAQRSIPTFYQRANCVAGFPGACWSVGPCDGS